MNRRDVIIKATTNSANNSGTERYYKLDDNTGNGSCRERDEHNPCLRSPCRQRNPVGGRQCEQKVASTNNKTCSALLNNDMKIRTQHLHSLQSNSSGEMKCNAKSYNPRCKRQALSLLKYLTPNRFDAGLYRQ
mmetsp:Transcript_51154/g.59772  ORF Transcript_51154/g.59772 Transcript_51154/m.59772 type:complete len:133 (+) Transcript_51154:42-440(+)